MRAERSDDSEVNRPPCVRSMNSLDSFGDYEGQFNLVEVSPGHVCATDCLNSCNEDLHADTTIACDSENDCQQMAELNRLAMLAERDMPFDLIFSGNKSLKSVYVTSAPSVTDRELPCAEPFGHENDDDTTSSLSSSDLKSIDSQPNILDSFISECAPPEGKLGPDLLSDGNLGVHVENIAPLSKCENAGFEPEGNNGTGLSENNGFIENRYAWLATRMEKSGMFYNRRDGHSYTSTKSLELQNPENDGLKLEASTSCNAMQQLSQKYRTNEDTLLDTLNNQINRLDKEILFYEAIVSPEPPAEIADKTLEHMENMSSPDVSTWLMPIHL